MNVSPADHDSSSRPSNSSRASDPELTDEPTSEAIQDWGDLVDHASWPRFEASLEHLLLDPARAAFVVLLTAPVPVVRPEYLPRRRGLASMFRRSAAKPSPDVPGLILAAGRTSTQVTAQIQDAQERFLLDGEQIATLHMLGWSPDEDVMTRVFTPSEEAAPAVTRVLLDVLRIPHPADMDYLFTQQA